MVLPGGCSNANTSTVFFNFTSLDNTDKSYWMERWEVSWCCHAADVSFMV